MCSLFVRASARAGQQREVYLFTFARQITSISSVDGTRAAASPLLLLLLAAVRVLDRKLAVNYTTQPLTKPLIAAAAAAAAATAFRVLVVATTALAASV